jgi:hypothetical protein
MRGAFARTWICRGYVCDPDPNAPFDNLEFGRANLGVPRRCRRPAGVRCRGFPDASCHAYQTLHAGHDGVWLKF